MKNLKSKLKNLDFKQKLYINQTITRTIQGEGKYAGHPSSLIRFAFCNLQCPWCDTKLSWINYEYAIENDEGINKLIDSLDHKHIMITGGEPLLYQQNQLFYNLIRKPDYKYEIETNGSLINEKSLLFKRPYNNITLNISPKLNSTWYKNNPDILGLDEKIKLAMSKFPVQLKFVHDNEKAILTFINRLDIPKDEYSSIIIMPLTPKRDKWNKYWAFEYVNKHCQRTLKFCIENGFTFDPRIHMLLFQDSKEQV